MRILPSTVEGVEIAESDDSIEIHDPFPTRALDYSVAVINRSHMAIAFLGVRFEMVKRDGKHAIAMQYSDALRHPEQSEFVPGMARLISIEHGVTQAVLEGVSIESIPGYQRILMNLDNVRKMSSVTASIDSVAFTDGSFHGPDKAGSFTRLASERDAEVHFRERVLESGPMPEPEFAELLRLTIDLPVLRRFSRLLDLYVEAGREAVLEVMSAHKVRIPLHRYHEVQDEL